MILTLDAVKAHLGIEGDERDALLEKMITLAQEAIQDYCGTQFGDDAPEPVKMAMMLLVAHYYKSGENGDSTFDDSMLHAFKSLLAPYCTRRKSPVVSVEQVKANLREQYQDEDALIEERIAQAQAMAEDYCRVQFDADAPQPVKLAVIGMASYYFEDRDYADPQSYKAMLAAFHNLLYPYRDPDKMF